MKTHSLRLRMTLTTTTLLFVVLALVLAVLTLGYASRLRHDLRHRLVTAGTTVAASDSDQSARQIAGGLALEGITTRIDSTPLPRPDKGWTFTSPIKAGTGLATHGDMLSLTQTLSNGTRVTFTASEAPINASIASLLRLETIIGLVGLATALALVVLVTRLNMRPLLRVVETATAVSDGDTTQRLSPDRTDTELGAMAAAFDKMVDSLQQAVAEARTAEAMMRRFVADAAHELRTPIAAVQASAEQLLREQPQRPERDELEAAIAAGTMRLGNLVGDLLSLARLQAAPDPHDDAIDLAAVVDAAVADARLRGGAATIDCTTNSLVGCGNADALMRALRNLLDNAVGAAPHGAITVTLAAAGNQAVITVIDTGPGVPAPDRERIFEPFARLSNTPTPGTGLGLAIARTIARQHRGDLRCEPSVRGATFTLRLPIATINPSDHTTATPSRDKTRDASRAVMVSVSSRRRLSHS